MRSMIFQIRCLALIGLLLSLLTSHAASLTASLDRDTIAVGEQATLTLSFDSQVQGAPQLPKMRGLSVSYVGEQSQTSFVNGQVSYRFMYNYQVSAAAPGEYQIPQLQADFNGVKVASNPLKLTVTKGGQTNASFAFLKLIVPKTNLYVGEVIPVETPLYIIKGQIQQFPQLKGDGFVLGKQPQPTQTRTSIGNNVYQVINFRTSVSAAKIGELTLGPAETEATLHIPRRGGLVDDFFDRFTAEQRHVTLTSDPQVLTVLPLPKENVPSSFNGAIGQFSFTISAGPTNLAVGDPITVKYVMRGRGNLDALTLPTLDWREFKTYPPSSTITNTDPLGIEGVKTFEQVVIPQNAEVKTLPEMSFSFFDPEQKAYRIIKGPSIELRVAAPSQTQAQPTVLATPGKAPEQPQTARDIVHIKNQLGVIAPSQRPWISQPGFVAVQGLPVLAWMIALFWRRRQDYLARNPRLLRQMAVQRTIRSGLTDLAKYAEAKDSAQFFSTLFRLLQEQIGERLDLPASAITESALSERSEFKTLSAETIQQVHELFQACNLARYAPKTTVGELQSLREKAQAALESLSKIP